MVPRTNRSSAILALPRRVAVVTLDSYTRPMSAVAPMTAEELLRLQPLHKRSELVEGAMHVREPAGFRHGRIASEVGARIRNHVVQRGLGVAVAAETGFILRRGPDTVRAPDVAFVSRDRLPPHDQRGFAEFAPDLVVEILSPDDRPGEVLAKCGDWLSAGCRLVWVVDPQRCEVTVYRADGSVAVVSEGGAVEGEEVLPGFAMAVTEVLGGPNEMPP